MILGRGRGDGEAGTLGTGNGDRFVARAESENPTEARTDRATVRHMDHLFASREEEEADEESYALRRVRAVMTITRSASYASLSIGAHRPRRIDWVAAGLQHGLL